MLLLCVVVLAWASMCMWVTARLSVSDCLPACLPACVPFGLSFSAAATLRLLCRLSNEAATVNYLSSAHVVVHN